MNQSETRRILELVRGGELSVADAVLKLKMQPFEDIGFAKLDHHRALRQGVAEVVYGAGKTPEQISRIAAAMLAREKRTILITRLSCNIAKRA